VERVGAIDKAQSIDRGRDIENKLAAAGGVEIEHRGQPFAAKQQVVGEDVAVDYALGQLAFEIPRQVLDLVVQRAANLAEVVRQPVAHRQVEIGDSLEAEAVVNSLLVRLADHVQVAERVADRL